MSQCNIIHCSLTKSPRVSVNNSRIYRGSHECTFLLIMSLVNALVGGHGPFVVVVVILASTRPEKKKSMTQCRIYSCTKTQHGGKTVEGIEERCYGFGV